MDPITLIVAILIFALAIWAGVYVCQQFALPDPIRWVIGVVLLIMLLYFLQGQFAGIHSFHFGR